MVPVLFLHIMPGEMEEHHRNLTHSIPLLLTFEPKATLNIKDKFIPWDHESKIRKPKI